MDAISKALKKLSKKEQIIFEQLLLLIEAGKYHQFDVKKLVGHDDIFRLRKGKYRIIFRVSKTGEIFILALERRSDRTYSKY